MKHPSLSHVAATAPLALALALVGACTNGAATPLPPSPASPASEGALVSAPVAPLPSAPALPSVGTPAVAPAPVLAPAPVTPLRPLTGLDRVPAELRPLLVETMNRQLLVGSFEVTGGGTSDDGEVVMLRETAGSGGGCRERLYRAAAADKKTMSWQEVGSDCCDRTAYPCDRSNLDAMYHLHRVLADKALAGVGKLIGDGVTVKHAASVDGKLKVVTERLTAASFGAQKKRDLISFGYEAMTVSCSDADAKRRFECRADAGGLHIRYRFERIADARRPQAPVTTLDVRLLGAEVDED